MLLARFNEAPAERGGKHSTGDGDNVMRMASMRPPLNAGENPADNRTGAAGAMLQ